VRVRGSEGRGRGMTEKTEKSILRQCSQCKRDEVMQLKIEINTQNTTKIKKFLLLICATILQWRTVSTEASHYVR
jgi:hypothetical protein